MPSPDDFDRAQLVPDEPGADVRDVVDREYWHFATPTEPRTPKILTPNDDAPILPMMEAPPVPMETQNEAWIHARLPQYDDPNFWAKPFNPVGLVCVPYYMLWYCAYRIRVPDMRMLVVNGISWQFDGGLAIDEHFQVKVMRGDDHVLTVTDMLASVADPDPAKQYVMQGHLDPMPTHVIADQNQTLSVWVRVLGTLPYNKLTTNAFNGCFRCLLQGWLASRMDSRDGAPQPVDQPPDMMREVVDSALQREIDGRTYDEPKAKPELHNERTSFTWST